VSLFLAQIASELTPILANGLGADPAKTQIIFHVCNALMLTIRSLQLYDGVDVILSCTAGDTTFQDCNQRQNALVTTVNTNTLESVAQKSKQSAHRYTRPNCEHKCKEHLLKASL